MIDFDEQLYPYGKAILNVLGQANEPMPLKHIVTDAKAPQTAVITFIAYLDGRGLIERTPEVQGAIYTPRHYSLAATKQDKR